MNRSGHSLVPHTNIDTVIESFEPFLHKKLDSDEWPGTRTVGTAEVFYYHLTHQSADLLKQKSHSLYEWMGRDLPDDLCIMRDMQQPWLLNTAHEHFAAFYVTDNERKELLEAIPEIKSFLGYQLGKLSGDVFRQVIDYAQRIHCLVSIAVRKKWPFPLRTQEILDKMAPYFINQETGIHPESGRTRVFTFAVNKKCTEILKTTVDAMSDWRQRGLPLALCLLGPDRKPWLVFESWERDSYIPLIAEEGNNISGQIPELKNYIYKTKLE